MYVTTGYYPVLFRRIYFAYESFFAIFWKIVIYFFRYYKVEWKNSDLIFSFHFESVYILGWQVFFPLLIK